MRQWLALALLAALACGGGGGGKNASDNAVDVAYEISSDVSGESVPSGCSSNVECKWAEKCGPPGQCAVPSPKPDVDLAKDFTLFDANKYSETFDKAVKLSDQAGNAIVVYFALAT